MIGNFAHAPGPYRSPIVEDVPSREIPCAASILTAPLWDSSHLALTEVARTRVSLHYETGDPRVPTLCLCTPRAVRLPNTVLTPVLPPPAAHGPRAALVAGDGGLRAAGMVWRVARWWRPPAPRDLPVPADLPAPVPLPETALAADRQPDSSYRGLDPDRLVGAGAGLTPAGDDVLAGALVTARATDDPRLEGWRRTTRAAMARHRTTAVSRGLLQAALDGYSTPELAGCLEAVCRGLDAAESLERLLAVGHSSGVALWQGVGHTLRTRSTRRAAA